jgi:hypothetical protein
MEAKQDFLPRHIHTLESEYSELQQGGRAGRRAKGWWCI